MPSIFDRFKKNQVNNVPNIVSRAQLVSPFSVGSKRFADAYEWLIQSHIYRGLGNVNYQHSFANDPESEKYYVNVEEFLETNAATLAFMLWNYGYAVVDGREADKNGLPKYRIPDQQEIKVNGSTHLVEGFDLVIYSDEYIFKGKPLAKILENHVNYIDVLQNGDEYLTEHLGALGILSGKGMPMTTKEKDEFLSMLKKKKGITRGEEQFLVTGTEVDFKQIDFHLKDLQLSEKIKQQLMLLADAYGVPFDLLSFSGQSTYANQEQAVRNLYSNAIAPLAEKLLLLGRYMIRSVKSAAQSKPSSYLTFTFDNVPELADDREKLIDYKLKMADLAMKIRDLGGDSSYYINELTKKEE